MKQSSDASALNSERMPSIPHPDEQCTQRTQAPKSPLIEKLEQSFLGKRVTVELSGSAHGLRATLQHIIAHDGEITLDFGNFICPYRNIAVLELLTGEDQTKT